MFRYLVRFSDAAKNSTSVEIAACGQVKAESKATEPQDRSLVGGSYISNVSL